MDKYSFKLKKIIIYEYIDDKSKSICLIKKYILD